MSATAPALVFPPPAGPLPGGIDGNQLLQSLPLPVLALDREDRIRFVNAAAAQFLGVAPLGRLLQDFFPEDCPLFTLLDQARAQGASVADREMAVETPALGHRLIAVDVAPLADREGWLSLTLQERSFTGRLDEALTRRGATRAMGTLAAALAHEVKNPLSGVRGAAQLLEPGLDEAGRALTHLICEEVDRVVALVDRMEMFTDERPIDFGPVNIHRVLDRVRQLAEAGFGRGRRFVCDYDPSLPPVLGNRDLLVQLFLNLVKNAAEATEEGTGVITLSTRFQVGLKLSEPDGGGRYLPLMVTVQDNGSGIPDAMRHCLFDPFASGKPGGKGLGLALVAKLVADHGGLIELASEPRRTQFRVLLPKAAEEEQP